MGNRGSEVLGVLMLAWALPAGAGIHYVAEMNTAEIAALDRSRTVVIMPGGILEEHGPYLPSNTDGLISDRLARDVAEAVVRRGWNALIFPALALGSGGANELAAKYPFPGTYAIRLNTLRAVYMDLAGELGEAGFRWIFVINVHGAPNHNRILDEAGEFFSETFQGRMVHITGGSSITADETLRSSLSEQARSEDAASGHAGIEETSLILFLRPDLVDPAHASAPSLPADAAHGWMPGVARKEGWPGYFGAPRFATAEYGARMYRAIAARFVEQAMSTLDGKSRPLVPRGPMRGIDDAAIARDRAIEQRQREWLQKKGLE